MTNLKKDFSIPSHFFESGPYEVWAPRQEWIGSRFTGRLTMQCIAEKLSHETARVTNLGWVGSEIRQAK